MLFLILLALAFGDYQWKPTNLEGHQALFQDGRQVGSLELATGIYHRLEGTRWIQADCPAPVPGQKETKDSKTKNKETKETRKINLAVNEMKDYVFLNIPW